MSVILTDSPYSARTLEWQQQRLGQDNPALTCSLYAHAFALLASRRFAESEKLLHRIATIQRIHRGTNHPAMAAALASLGRLKATEKKWREAEDYLQRAWDIRKAALTPYHIRTLPAAALPIRCCFQGHLLK